jgi:phosphoribosylformylglycinamidine synthase PurS subunit
VTLLARVFVMPKAAILDPQGKAVASSLHALGYDEVADARLGKLVELRLEAADEAAARSRVDEMCRRLLANDVIEDYRLEVEPAAQGAGKARP